MATFPLTHYTLGEDNPESSTKVKFGNGYSFGSKPKGPDQIIFVLQIETLMFFQSAPGVLDLDEEPGLNMGKLLDFYEEHKTYKRFDFVHPWRGTVSVKFEKPIAWRLKKGGRGTVDPFEIRLELQP